MRAWTITAEGARKGPAHKGLAQKGLARKSLAHKGLAHKGPKAHTGSFYYMLPPSAISPLSTNTKTQLMKAFPTYIYIYIYMRGSGLLFSKVITIKNSDAAPQS